MEKDKTWLIRPITLAIVLVAMITLTFKVNANETSMRYDGAQLWRIHNISEAVRTRKPNPFLEMENKFDANIWFDGSNFDGSNYLDISIDRQHLDAAKSYLGQLNLVPDVLNSNIQTLFDSELTTDINMTQAKHAYWTKRAITSGMNWTSYQDLSTIYDYLREMRDKFPEICTLIDIGRTFEGRELFVLRISENASSYKKIWIDGGIHAREWVSPATVTFIINNLLSNWENQPAYIKQKTWLIMPVLNPDGYVHSRKRNRLWRKNRSPIPRSRCIGVDLNRNFGKGLASASTDPCKETYIGRSVASELETQAVIKFLTEQNENLEAFLTYHSFGQVIAYPRGLKAKVPTDKVELLRVGKLAAQRIKKTTRHTYGYGPLHQLVWPIDSSSDEWARSVLGTKYVYTVELRDRGTYDFVLPAKQILGTGAEGYIIATTVAEAIANQTTKMPNTQCDPLI